MPWPKRWLGYPVSLLRSFPRKRESSYPIAISSIICLPYDNVVTGLVLATPLGHAPRCSPIGYKQREKKLRPYMSDWIKFYDFKHSVIYVNARHRDVHYRTIAEDIRAYVPSPQAHVLDYGCGEATSADLVADACARLVLVEAAPNVRASLTMRYAGHPRIAVIAAEQVAGLPKASFDLIVMHSVAQYLTPAELDRLLAIFRSLLKLGGIFLLGDVVPPNLAAPAAALSLLRFGAANGFFWAAALGLARIFTSDYLRLKKTAGLSHYSEAGALERLRATGFAAERARRNIGHNQHRMTFVCKA
jgi:SAM-dependent methyltransferase